MTAMAASASYAFGKGGDLAGTKGISVMQGPPMLDRSKVTIEGLAFLGLNLSRNHPEEAFAHPDSISRQTQYNFNKIQDRTYTHVVSTDDNGWLCGGGENGDSFKLTLTDSAHCEIIRLGTLNPAWGGVSIEDVRAAMTTIKIPHMAVIPSFVLRNGDTPPELELKFDLSKPAADTPVDQWDNWQLRFVHNQLFQALQFPARFCPGPHHMTFLRKTGFRDAEHAAQYFSEINDVVSEWRKLGPQTLEPETDSSVPGFVATPLVDPLTKQSELDAPHGIYLFKTRSEPIEYYAPNWEGPYDTPEARAIIEDVLSTEWDEATLSWIPRKGPEVVPR